MTRSGKFFHSYKNIILGTSFSLIILLANMYFSFMSMKDAKKSNDWVSHTLSVIAKLQLIEKHAQTLSTTQRAYILTSQKRYEADFYEQKPKIFSALSRLKKQVRDNDEQLENIIKLEGKISQLISTFEKNIRLVNLNKNIDAANNVKSGEAQDQLDEIIRDLTFMTDIEQKLFNDRQALSLEASDETSMFVIIGSVISFALILIGCILIIMEFRRRIRTQEELHQTSQTQKAILDSSPFAIIAVDIHGHINTFNPAAEELLGYKAEEVMGKNPSIFHLPEEVAAMASQLTQEFNEAVPVGIETFTYLAKQGIIRHHNWTYVKKNGEQITVKLSVSPQKNLYGELTGFIGMAFDVTRQMQDEKALIETRELALAGTKAKTEFLANMSHEIRTPMNAIMGMAELLTETPLNEEQKKYVTIFRQAGESLLNIINDILDLSKIEAGHFELDSISFDLNSLIKKSVDIMALKAHQKQLELIVDVDDHLHHHLIGDPNRLRQVLLNLLGNAIKFTKRGEVLLRISGRTQNNQQNLKIEIQDTGIGMTEEQLQKLFRRFEQADNSITREFGGTGLGLSIVKKLVDLMGGKVQVTSSAGIGTRFTIDISLPIDDSKIDDSFKINLQGKSVLVIDDTKTNRFILKKILESQGAFVHEAEDGESGLDLVRSKVRQGKPYDLILLDCRMPGIDGFAVAAEIQKNSALSGSILMMLASDNRPGDIARAKTLDLKSFLIKPILKEDLLLIISRALNESVEIQSAPAEVKESVDEKPLKILLVDDNFENRLVIKSFLKNYPWKIEEAKNGVEALNFFKQGSFDIVLMDMQMPIMDGYTATRELRKYEEEEKLKPTPVLALTAFAMKEEIEKSLDAGCHHHVSKPVSKDGIINCIKNLTSEILVVADKDLEDLIPDYLKNRSLEVIKLKEALAGSDLKLIQEIGHKLRGSAGSYGFENLSVIGKEIEENAKIGNKIVIRQMINQYELYLARVKVSY